MRSSSERGKRVPAVARALAVMRPAIVRCALPVSILSLVFCAPPPKPDAVPEPSVTLEGEIALAGEDPLERMVVLADAGGSVCALESARFEYELMNLAGHRVRVTGRIAGKAENVPEFLVESYEMAPIDGRAPVMGALVFRGTDLVLIESRSSVEYALAGSLADALRAFSGFKVWIDGPATPSEKKGVSGVTISIEGYGILAPPADGVSSPPADATPVRP